MDTAFEFILYFLYGVGAFLSWIFKGCKTTLKDELSDVNKTRNASIALLMFIFIVGIVIYINNAE